MRMILMLVILMMASPAWAESIWASEPAHFDRSCVTAADCVVKDAGSCCGYNPQCLHRDQPVDLAAIKSRCEKLDVAGVCGFVPLSGCACVAGACVGLPQVDEEPEGYDAAPGENFE